MEAFLFTFVVFVVCGGLGVLAAMRNSPVDGYLFGLFGSGVMLVLFVNVGLSTGDAFSPLKSGVVYTVSGNYYKSENDAVISLSSPSWGLAYPYKIECGSLVGGCPDKFPGKFVVVNNGRGLVIVPLLLPDKK